MSWLFTHLYFLLDCEFLRANSLEITLTNDLLVNCFLMNWLYDSRIVFYSTFPITEHNLWHVQSIAMMLEELKTR